jgi:CheY-like chemotaxis protein
MLQPSGTVRPQRTGEPSRNRLSAVGRDEAPREIELISYVRADLGILIVDDDQGVRSMLALLLPKHGFGVWQAENGRQALQVYAEQRGRIGVVLMDVCMPELDGPRTLRALRALDPDVRCCLMSGHGGTYTDAELLEMGAARFFPKPFRLAELVHELKRLTTDPAEAVEARQVFRLAPADAPETERRAQVRYLCHLQHACRPADRGASNEIWLGRIRDISVSGLRVFLGRRFEPGTLLTIEIPGADREDTRRLLARVVRATAESEGQWGLGCSFISDLSEAALQSLLAGSNPEPRGER